MLLYVMSKERYMTDSNSQKAAQMCVFTSRLVCNVSSSWNTCFPMLSSSAIRFGPCMISLLPLPNLEECNSRGPVILTGMACKGVLNHLLELLILALADLLITFVLMYLKSRKILVSSTVRLKKMERSLFEG